LLGSKLLPEVISAILNRYVTVITPTNYQTTTITIEVVMTQNHTLRIELGLFAKFQLKTSTTVATAS